MDQRTRREAFATALRLAREGAGLRQGDLAEAIGETDQQKVSKWERAEVAPSPEVADRIEQALNLGPGALTLKLGYLPPRAAGELVEHDATSALLADPYLDDDGRAVMLNTYRVLTGRRRRA